MGEVTSLKTLKDVPRVRCHRHELGSGKTSFIPPSSCPWPLQSEDRVLRGSGTVTHRRPCWPEVTGDGKASLLLTPVAVGLGRGTGSVSVGVDVGGLGRLEVE